MNGNVRIHRFNKSVLPRTHTHVSYSLRGFFPRLTACFSPSPHVDALSFRLVQFSCSMIPMHGHVIYSEHEQTFCECDNFCLDPERATFLCVSSFWSFWTSSSSSLLFSGLQASHFICRKSVRPHSHTNLNMQTRRKQNENTAHAVSALHVLFQSNVFLWSSRVYASFTPVISSISVFECVGRVGCLRGFFLVGWIAMGDGRVDNNRKKTESFLDLKISVGLLQPEDSQDHTRTTGSFLLVSLLNVERIFHKILLNL